MATIRGMASECDLWERSRAGSRCELVDGEIRVMSRGPAHVMAVSPCSAVSCCPRTSARLDKVGEYLKAGTRLVWVVDPRAATVVVYRSLSDIVVVGRDDELDGGEVLPGFRCRPSDFL